MGRRRGGGGGGGGGGGEAVPLVTSMLHNMGYHHVCSYHLAHVQTFYNSAVPSFECKMLLADATDCRFHNIIII